MWLAGYSQEEIAEKAGITKETVSQRLKSCQILESFPKPDKLAAEYNDDFEPPLYTVWTFAKKTNAVSHFGNSEQRIVDNLLYLYTQPFDMVCDPFAGGGSTIDVCKKRLRRYFVSDRKPKIGREDEIRLHDLNDGLPKPPQWKDVKLVYLDPPYWKQAEGQYSNDANDLANMPIEQFRTVLSGIVNDYAKKLSSGAYIALIIQPTQWKSENKQFTDHIAHLLNDVQLPIETRIQAPYSTEQYNAQQVNWAKENRKLLVISREVIVWRVV
jgi:transcriptional regulator with XRE-family HTH domain